MEMGKTQDVSVVGTGTQQDTSCREDTVKGAYETIFEIRGKRHRESPKKKGIASAKMGQNASPSLRSQRAKRNEKDWVD